MINQQRPHISKGSPSSWSHPFLRDPATTGCSLIWAQIVRLAIRYAVAFLLHPHFLWIAFTLRLLGSISCSYSTHAHTHKRTSANTGYHPNSRDGEWRTNQKRASLGRIFFGFSSLPSYMCMGRYFLGRDPGGVSPDQGYAGVPNLVTRPKGGFRGCLQLHVWFLICLDLIFCQISWRVGLEGKVEGSRGKEGMRQSLWVTAVVEDDRHDAGQMVMATTMGGKGEPTGVQRRRVSRVSSGHAYVAPYHKRVGSTGLVQGIAKAGYRFILFFWRNSHSHLLHLHRTRWPQCIRTHPSSLGCAHPARSWCRFACLLTKLKLVFCPC